MAKNLLYYSSFGNKPSNLFITASAILSSKKFKDESFDILLYCNDECYVGLNKYFPGITKEILVWKSYCSYSSPIDESSWSRYEIFNWIDIDNYEKVLYLDTDTIISGNPSDLFSLPIEKNSPIFVLDEKSHPAISYHGQQLYELFDIDYSKMLGFTTGIILFCNCRYVRRIFKMSRNFCQIFIQKYEKKYNKPVHFFSRCDQPTLNFLLNKKNKFDSKALRNYVINNPRHDDQYLISHFPGGVGNPNKPAKVMNFLQRESNSREFSEVIEFMKNSPILKDFPDLLQ